jgi:hypothetical protein
MLAAPRLFLFTFVLLAPAGSAKGQCLQWQSPPQPSSTVRVLAPYDDGTGVALYAGGDFASAGPVTASHIARWSGTNWAPLGSGTDNIVYCLAGFDDGNGPALYAGGEFSHADGTAARRIARWNGTQWSSVGNDSGMVTVTSLVEFNDGSGSALYAGGQMSVPLGAGNFENIARWNGQQWTSVGGGVQSLVQAMVVFDDGSGPALFVAGNFTSVGGNIQAEHVAKWNGSTWSVLGSGLDDTVISLAVFDDGTGPALFAGGDFMNAGAIAANHVAKWNGTTWSALGSGVNSTVYELAVFNAGPVPALYAAGSFTTAGAVSPNRVAKWEGHTWSTLGSGVPGTGYALAVFDDGADGVPDLYVGGTYGLQEWTGCMYPGVPYCFGDGSGSACPCDPGQIGQPGSGCRNSFGTGGHLRADGVASIHSDTVTLEATGLPQSAIGLYFQGSIPQATGLGTSFGDGLLCVNGLVRRLGTRSATAGTSAFGHNDPLATPLSIVGAVPAIGGTRYYQLWYRDPPAFCTTSTFNLTNGLRIDWQP